MRKFFLIFLIVLYCCDSYAVVLTHGRVASRNASAAAKPSAAATGRANVATRASCSGVETRVATNDVAKRGTTARGASNVVARPSRNATSTNQIATTRRAMQNGSANIARADVTTNDAVNTPIYSGNKSANAVARASMRANSGGSVRASIPTISASVDNTAISAVSTPVVTSAASATAAMDGLAQITAFCKAQYTECMDNFCNVLDEKQGRCSCSKNIKNYGKTDAALKSATEALQDVAQQIQYIGLTREEIETLFSQTEAELQMQATTDNSQLKNDLDKIKGLIVQVKSGAASSTEIDTGLSMDLSGLINFNISSAGFDLGALFGSQTANTNSISNQRGEQLYKTAAARCKTAVLNECQAQGVDISIVSNSYDMEIDKQCVAYERSLTDANDEMLQTVRNAKSVLQRARLMVAQQKNVYDLRGCLNALDSCMQDDFVCGNEYENCLDPSGKYIVDGEVVLGSTPGHAITDDTEFDDMSAGNVYSTAGLYSVWNYSDGSSTLNAWAGDEEGSLSEYVTKTLSNANPEVVGDTMASYLQHKIGYIEDSKSYGMCSSVLSKCQDYTYENGKYSPDNRVVEEYLMRTLVKIKNAQDRVLVDYAERCISDVSSCLGENNYDSKNTSSNKSNIAINACRSQIITCMSVNGNAAATPTPAVMAQWVTSVMSKDNGANSKECQGGTWNNGICVYPEVVSAVTEELLKRTYVYKGIDNRIYVQQQNMKVVVYNPFGKTLQVYACNSHNQAHFLSKSPNRASEFECYDSTIGSVCDYYTENGTCTVANTDVFVKRISDAEGPVAETEVCLSNGDAAISQNKKYCIVYGVKTRGDCVDVMKKSGGKLYFSVPYNNQHESAVTGTLFEPSICFYLLPSVYDAYKQTCISRYAGTFDEYVSVNDAECKGITVESKQACTDIGGSLKWRDDLTTCRYGIANVLDGDIYTAKDLRAISCLEGMEVVDEETGNCKCKQGYDYESAYKCIPIVE